MENKLNQLCVDAAVEMVEQEIVKRVQYVNQEDVGDRFNLSPGRLLKVTIEFVDEAETFVDPPTTGWNGKKVSA